MDIELIGVDELTAILKDTLKEPGKLIVLDGVQVPGRRSSANAWRKSWAASIVLSIWRRSCR
jgi:hypothetical protein